MSFPIRHTTRQGPHIVIIGAGIGGLVAAFLLSARGLDVTVIERTDAPGGKMREIAIGSARIDAGPTVLTMRHVFDEIFADAGMSLSDHISCQRAQVLARHIWSPVESLDLFADIDRSVEAIGEFSGAADARSFREFCATSERIFRTLDQSFMRHATPSITNLIAQSGMRDLWGIKPFSSFWQTLCKQFRDQRLRQLFGRYTTYCGSSPFEAPATLMLIAHAEQAGVWLVDGGMQTIANALAKLASRNGATFRYATEADQIVTRNGQVSGIHLDTGEILDADVAIVNADVAALSTGLFGDDVSRCVPKLPASKRSLSAVTWAMLAEAKGSPLLRHTVFFGNDYASEFDDIFQKSRCPQTPTVYICAQDRNDWYGEGPEGPERLFLIMNAPARGDSHPLEPEELEQCEDRVFGLLEYCGLKLKRQEDTTVRTTPSDFNQLFPATGGAIYGMASHGWRASFQRPGCQTRVRGLFLTGGSVHPGPGVPMAALSGRQAAATVLADFASTRTFHATATAGGTSTG